MDLCFFFFKQKTAYEMRISDWSSDVCSSDLEDSVDAATDFRELYLQTIVHREERVVVEQSLAESGLIADDKHALAGLTQPRDRPEAAGDRSLFGDGHPEVRRVLILAAVAVATYKLHGAHFRAGQQYSRAGQRCVG